MRGKRKVTKELAVFLEIWNERPHMSEISGRYIREFSPYCFSHVLTKGSHPEMRLNKLNIVIVTPQEHRMWETEGFRLVNIPEWDWKFKLKEFLKTRARYHGKWKR